MSARPGTTIRRLRAALRHARRTEGRSAFAVLWPLVRFQRRRFVLIGALSLAVGVFESALIMVLAQVGLALARGDRSLSLDTGPLDGVEVGLGAVLVATTALALGRFVVQALMSVQVARASSRFAARLRRRVLDGFLGASWPVKAEERTGHLNEVLSRMVWQVVGMLIAAIRLVSSFLTLAMITLSAFVVSPLVAAGILVVGGLLALALRPLVRLSRSYSRRNAAYSMEFANAVTETSAIAQDIQVFGVDEPFAARLQAITDRLERASYRSRLTGGLVGPSYQLAATTLLLVAMAIVYAVDLGAFASLATVILLFIRATSYGQSLQGLVQTVHEAAPYAEALEATEARFRADPIRRDGLELGRVESLRFEDVSFAYRPGRPTLHPMSFTLRRGETIGVVGPSGAGKSTLIQLLLRLRPAGSGTYEVNGLPAERYSYDSWTRRFAMVAQEPHLFAGTVRENITLFRDGVDDIAVESAARRAHIHDEIVALPEGYDTWVGDQGKRLSGGQRQRVSIARALATTPDVLVLDEPTSALDMRSEQLVQETLEELRGDTILVIIAHRISTLRSCDRIMVLGDGHLQAFGTPREVLDQNEFFRQALARASLSP